MSLEVLKAEGLKLERAERTELVHFLIDTLLENEAPEDDFELSEELKALLDERLAAFENGTVVLIPGEEAERQIAEKYGIAL